MLLLDEISDVDVALPRSQASSAYDTIRSGILSGRHVAGTKLKIQELAADLQVSPGAIREALSRMVPEQLVISRDQRGFVVAPLSVADLEDLTELRCEIDRLRDQNRQLALEVNRIGPSWRAV